MQKRTGPIFSHLDQSSLVNKGFIIWPKTELFLAGPTQEVPSGQDRWISPTQVANQNTHLPARDSAIIIRYIKFHAMQDC